MAPPEKLILIDACCLINLYATGHLREILAAQPLPAGVAEEAARESLFVRRGGKGDDADEREPLDLEPSLAAGLLVVVAAQTDQEYESFVNFAGTGLDDGEAMTLALAQARAYEVATDDRKARRDAAAAVPPIVCHSTVSMLRRWEARFRVDGDALRETLAAVEQRARYRPSAKDTADCAWWESARRTHG